MQTSCGSCVSLLLVTLLGLFHGSTGQCYQNGVSELSASYGPSSKKSMVSPGYPNQYPDNCRYDWLITADPGFIIKLEVEDIELESNDGCTYDYVEVFDGSSTGQCSQNGVSELSASYGPSSKKSMVSPGYPDRYPNNCRYDWLITADPGFVIELEVEDIELESNDGCTYDYVEVFDGSSTGQCSQNGVSELSASYGPSSKKSMVSPGYPNQYPDNCRYDWLITADPGFIIELEVENIELESNYGCTSDYVEVFDGTTHYQCTRRTKELKANWNGTWSSLYSPGYPYYYENDLRCGWRIVTDYAGYVIKLEAISVNLEVSDACEYDSVKVYDGGCGTSSSPVRLVAKYDTLRTLTSPGYPNHYDNNLHCVWRIEVDSSWLVVKLRTSTVSLEEEDNCQYDALTVYDGNVSGYERGFVVSYEGVPSTDVPTTTPKSDSSPSDSGNTGAVLAVAFTCVGVLGIGLIVLYCCCCHCMRKRTNSGPTAGTVQFSTHQTPTVPTAPTPNTTIPVINNSVFMLATPTSPSSPTLYYPGAFAAAGTTNPAYSSNGDAPPSYFSLQFDNSSSDGATQQGPVAPKTPPNMGAPPSYTEAIQLQTQPSASPVPSAPEL
ncbi:hypothetical protein BaRGS_00001836 [Batillaria attramentaria]|uniref:CUB domain-containing protein n=1 Tax=Batillaria attramentaria TaxID=370345 RepID=A0ABD0M622_9CAEN